jgi:serine/threonine kinase 38
MLIDKYGHIKLSDFGLAKISENFGENVAIKNKYNKNKPTHQKMFSCVGTAYYVAPEVLKKTGYSEDIDWWSVGVIFFEMLAGFAPFCAEETKEVCYKVMNWKKFLKIPDNVIISKEAEDLISRMINNSEERLGKNGVEEIKAHPFFKNIDWDNIRNTKAPFVPELKNDYDTKYFDELDYEEEFYPPKMKFKKRKDIEFLGYTYKEEDELCKEYYDEDDDINKIYNDILEKYKINSNGVNTNNNKSNSIKENNNTNSMQSYSQNNKLKNINSNRKLSVNTEQNLIWSKKKKYDIC